MVKNQIHPAEQYAEDVRSGKIVACHWVRRAVDRYYRDLDEALDKGWYFSRQHAIRAITFIEKLRHVKGKWAGQNLTLEPWQQFVVWNLFGFLMAGSDKRRFIESYLEVARKNGKTTFAAGIALYMEIADKESGAEVYSVAASRDQARICFDTARKMVRGCDLSELCVVTANAVAYERLGGTYQPLSSDAGNLDGKNSHCVILDEYHAHKTDEVYDVMQTSFGAREQPLMFIITTAGKSMASPCYTYRKTMTQILDGVVEADRHFAIIYTMDDVSEVDDPAMWIKANPCLDVSLSRSWLEEQHRTMRNTPVKETNILTKTFNMWVDAPTVWIPDKAWADIKSTTPIESLTGRPCVAALDLASVNDYTALALLFNENDRCQCLWKFWIPLSKYQERTELLRENANVEEWVRRGLVTVTDGNVTDYDQIVAEIQLLAEKYDITAIAYDPWNASKIAIQLTEIGANMQPFTQTIGNYAAPTKEFERLVGMGAIEHYDNPVARWMLSNVVIREDVNGNKRPDKGKSSEKIDGIVAAIMALGQSMSDRIEEGQSVYEERGLLGWEDE